LAGDVDEKPDVTYHKMTSHHRYLNHIRAAIQERRKKEREEEEKRMAEQRAAEDARRKAEEVSKSCLRKKSNTNYKSLQLRRILIN